MTDEISRPEVPATLKDLLDGAADPFARHPAASAAAPTAPANPSTPGATGEMYPCPCVCQCGNDTSMPLAKVTEGSMAAAVRRLRCEPCVKAGHLTNPPTTATPQARPASAPTRDIGEHDIATRGTRTGTPIVLRTSTTTDQEAEWDRQAAIQAEQARRDAAEQKWMRSLGERWSRPLDKDLLPEVEDRLARLSDSRGVHGSSLLVVGPAGRGKTWVGYTYARTAVARRLLWPQEIQHGSEGDLMEPIVFGQFSDRARKTSELLNKRTRMLFIDDVGSYSFPKPDDRWSLYTRIVDWAYADHRTLILTTNLSLGADSELERWIGVRAYGRLKSMIGPQPIFMVDADKRDEMTKIWEAEYEKHAALDSSTDR